jgi:hypothetical protein
MGNYVWSTEGISRDELHGTSGETQRIWNVNVGASAVIERGMLLCASSAVDVFSQVTSEADANKVLVIARDDFVADEDHTVTQVYSAGGFNASKIKLGGTSALTIEPFRETLRRENIILTDIQDKFGHENY